METWVIDAASNNVEGTGGAIEWSYGYNSNIADYSNEGEGVETCGTWLNCVMVF